MHFDVFEHLAVIGSRHLLLAPFKLAFEPHHNAVVQPGQRRSKDFLDLEVKVIEIFLYSIKFVFFLLKRNGFYIQLSVVMLDYIS